MRNMSTKTMADPFVSIASAHPNFVFCFAESCKNKTPLHFLIVAASKGRGRKQRLSMDEEKLIADAVLEFQHNGTPLSRASILNLAMTFTKTLPAERRQSIGFKDDRPGDDWLGAFLKRSVGHVLKNVQIWSMIARRQ